MGIADEVRAALEPHVGCTVADTCVRATALKLGKTSDDLCAQDLPELEVNIRRLLEPVAPLAAIEDAIGALRSSRWDGGVR
ncbi:MAG: hypothetical protein U1E26_03815 [Coriobacteriia bacterium]|nr:hypothetical protein [Coriobacteriia bacterium]